MSQIRHKRSSPSRGTSVPVFAALGDETRLQLVTMLSGGRRFSITRLTEGSTLTRQAITKHLRVLQRAGLVHAARSGRETVFALEPRPLERAQQALHNISCQWDEALARLKAFVEE